MLGEHGRLGKTTFHEASVHVPMIVCGPGVPAGERRRQLAEQTDLISTFLDFAGAEPPAHLEGQSMLPAIRDASAETKPFVHAWLEFHFGELHAMVRGENLKLCRLVGVPRRSSIPETFELHGVTRDPWELDNLWPDNATSAEARATRREFADYFWRKCGMMGCPPATRDALLGT